MRRLASRRDPRANAKTDRRVSAPRAAARHHRDDNGRSFPGGSRASALGRDDVRRARDLYRQACTAGDVYGCLHLDLLAAEDAGAPSDPDRALEHWRHACEHGHVARACAFVGVMYEDGPDGVARDEEKSMQAMSRACELGEPRACEWVRSHPD